MSNGDDIENDEYDIEQPSTDEDDLPHLANFEWNEDYKDFKNRFEAWIGADKIKELKTEDSRAMYEVIHDWLGMSTRTGRIFPTQRQMDFFCEVYDKKYFDILEHRNMEKEAEPLTWEYSRNRYYNETNKSFMRTKEDKREYFETKEVHRTVSLFGRGRTADGERIRVLHKRILIVDIKTNKVLAHKFDEDEGRYLGSQY
jgi:hypothetical protein